MSRLEHTGSLDVAYARQRATKKSLRYRLWRRGREVSQAINQFCTKTPEDIIDLGSADGRMLYTIHQEFTNARCVGVEYNPELVDFAKAEFPVLKIIQGDIQSLEFPDDSFDVAIATAVIEHVPSPVRAMWEIKRVLRSGGILVLTSPAPFWEKLATMVGHLADDQHNEVMNLDQLASLALQTGFTVLKAQRFMLSPVGMPFEFAVEMVLRRLHLNFMMANQLLVSRC